MTFVDISKRKCFLVREVHLWNWPKLEFLNLSNYRLLHICTYVPFTMLSLASKHKYMIWKDRCFIIHAHWLKRRTLAKRADSHEKYRSIWGIHCLWGYPEITLVTAMPRWKPLMWIKYKFLLWGMIDYYSLPNTSTQIHMRTLDKIVLEQDKPAITVFYLECHSPVNHETTAWKCAWNVHTGAASQ